MPDRTNKPTQDDATDPSLPIVVPPQSRYRVVLDMIDSRSDNDLEHVKQALLMLVQLLMESR